MQASCNHEEDGKNYVSHRLLDHASLCLLDKTDQQGYVFALISLSLEFFDGLGGVQFRIQQQPKCMVNFADTLFAEASSFQPNRIQAISLGIPGSHGLGKRQNVFGNHSSASDVGVCADTAELMDRAERSYGGPIFHDYMTGESSGIGQEHVVANRGIVADMGIGHDQRVAADPCHSAALGRASVDGHTFANDVLVANLDTRIFSAEAQVLRLDADGAKRKEPVTGADLCRAVDDNVRDQFATLSQFHIRTHDTIGADRTRGWNLCLRIDDCSGMEHWNWVI